MSRAAITRWGAGPKRPHIFILHCGLDIKRVEKVCEKLGLPVSVTHFRREEVFAYYMRLDMPRPDLIIIRSHFRGLLNNLNHQKGIPTIVVSTHQRPADCPHPFIRACHGYEGSEALPLYRQLATAVFGQLAATLKSGTDPARIS